MKQLKLKSLLGEGTVVFANKYNIKYHRKGNTFTADMSDLKRVLMRHTDMKHPITLFNPKTSGRMEFIFDKIDYVGSGEDRELAGWEYKSKDGKLKFVIFNE